MKKLVSSVLAIIVLMAPCGFPAEPFSVDFVSSDAWILDIGEEPPHNGAFRINAEFTATEDVFISLNNFNSYIEIDQPGHEMNYLFADPVFISAFGNTSEDTVNWALVREGESRTMVYFTEVIGAPVTGQYRFDLFEVGWSYSSSGMYDQVATLPPDQFRTNWTTLYQVPEPKVTHALGIGLLLILITMALGRVPKRKD